MIGSGSDRRLETYLRGVEFERIGNLAVRAAQEENRRLGIPNVYSINGIIYYELPNGELSREDPYTGDKLAE
jgi:hypothetical protein